MPKCKKCSKSGLFLKIESDTGLCVSCNEAFARDAKDLVAKVMDAKSRASVGTDPGEIASACDDVEKYGNELIALDKAYGTEPSPTLVDLVETHKKMRDDAGR
jgi:acetyl-CoA carboxylase beta subunit